MILEDNDAVRIGRRAAAAGMYLLGISLLAGAQQYQDRDYSKSAKNTSDAPPPEMRVDINHATMEALLKVPGMTATWAGRIVRFRPYHAKNELVEHGVVTSEVYARIQNYVIAHRQPKGTQ